jgi:multiple sugar transport system substrate-binding protein
MFDQTEHADAAWLWMEFLSQPENLTTWTYGQETTTLLPTRQSLLDDPQLAENHPFLVGFAENMSCAVTSNIVQPRWPEIEVELNEQLGAAIYGDISATEALTEAAQVGQEIITEG